MRRRAGSGWVGALFSLALLGPGRTSAQEAAPPVAAPTGVAASDTPNDGGNSVTVEWQALAAEPAGLVYAIERREASSDTWVPAGEVPVGTTRLVDTPLEDGEPVLENGVPYTYRVIAVTGDRRAASAATEGVAPVASFFNRSRWLILAFLLAFVGSILALIRVARSGRALYIRPIAGLNALEEAVGRATEMGKPVFFMPGIDEANNIQTLYGMVILQHVTRLVARYETPIVAVGKAFVVPLAQETVKQGYHDAGRPELYQPSIVRYFSDEQFATVTAVAGIFLREKPATNLYFGSFYAESLILAETGLLTKSIQIAGTGNIHQLPFFVVACDYTLIGEEFFAVSAYLSKDPKLIGSLKAMDLAKAWALAMLAVGFIAATLNKGWGQWVSSLFQVT